MTTRSAITRGLAMLLAASALSPVAAAPTQSAAPLGRLGGVEIALPASVRYAEIAAGQSPADAEQSVVIMLADEPAATSYARASDALSDGAGLPRALRAGVLAAVTSAQLAQIEHAQQRVLGALAPLGAQVLFRNQRVYNGIAVRAPQAALAALRQLPGVTGLLRIEHKERDNADSVPLIGAPAAWSAAPGGLTGAGIRIGIIDTGIDYLHATFGGAGAITPDLYVSNVTAVITDIGGYPSAKIGGGWDFAGDAYNASAFGSGVIPQPDPDPMDCDGHGTHVAATAAGLGVTAAGATYTGAYTVGLAFDGFRVGPGVAPGALLFALRVFGCHGSTDLTDAALEWALDPNGDGDFSDRLDIVNLSLGSSFGSADDATAMAANNLAAAGVVVVASAGNSGDTAFVVGSPATADRVMAVAGSDDGVDLLDGIALVSPLPMFGLYPALQSTLYHYPYITSTMLGTLAYPISDTRGCSPFTITDTVVISGNIALLDWSHANDISECGSATRVTNAYAAGARGVVLAYDLPTLDIFIGGSPKIASVIVPKSVGDELRARIGEGISVVLSPAYNRSQRYVDAQRVNTSYGASSRGPRRRDLALKPDVAAPAVSVYSARAGSGNDGISFSGTSMAAPHVTGEMALLRQRWPFWSTEELKALAMNTARQAVSFRPNVTGTLPLTLAVHTPTRVGAGRIDAAYALDTDVVAYNDGGAGRVSLSFGALEPTAPTTTTRWLRVVNKGPAPISYTLTYSSVAPVPGVGVAFSPTLVGLSPYGVARVQVDLTVDPAQLVHTMESTLAATQGGTSREWLTEESGLVLLDPDDPGRAELRVPLYAALRPASDMAAGPLSLNQPAMTLAGSGVDGVGLPPARETSYASAFQLGYWEPQPPADTAIRYAALKAVGVTSDYTPARGILSSTLYFGVGSHANWSTPTAQDVEFDVYVDTNGDNNADIVVFNYNLANALGYLQPNDVFVGAALRLSLFGQSVQTYTNGIPPALLHIPSMRSNVMAIPLSGADLRIASPRTLRYQVVAYARERADAVDQTPILQYNPGSPMFDVTANRAGLALWRDLPGDKIPVRLASPGTFVQARASNAHGVLLLHYFNAQNNRAQAVPIGPWVYNFPLVQR